MAECELTKDWFDYKGGSIQSVVNIGVKSTAALAASEIARVYVPEYAPIINLANVIYLSKDLISLGWYGSANFIEDENFRPRTDPALGTTTARLIFKGDRWSGETTIVDLPELVRNTPKPAPPTTRERIMDKLLFWRRPEPDPLVPANAPDNVWARTYDSVLRDLTIDSEFEYSKAFLLRFPPTAPHAVTAKLRATGIVYPNSMSIITVNKVIEPSREAELEQGLLVNKDKLTVISLQPGVIEEIGISQNDSFMDSYKLLNDGRLDVLVERAKEAKGDEEVRMARVTISDYLARQVYEHLAGVIGNNEITFNKDEKTGIPDKVRKGSWFKFLPLSQTGNELKIRIAEPNGQVKDVPVSNVLKVEDPKRLLTHRQGMPPGRGQIAYSLFEAIKDNTKYVEADIPSTEDMAKELAKLGIRADINGMELRDLVSARRTFRSILKKATTYIPVMGIAALVLFVQPTAELTKYGFSLLPKATPEITSQGDSRIDETVFSSSPEHSLDWRVDAYNGVSAGGYYLTGTSERYLGEGKWEPMMKRKSTFPLDVSEGQPGTDPMIVLRSSSIEKRLKIPIKDGTKLRSLIIQDEKAASPAFTVFELEDGSLELEIAGSSSRQDINEIRAVLVPSPTNQIKAIRRNSEVDINKLDWESTGFVIRAGIDHYKGVGWFDPYMSERDGREHLADYIRRNHLYKVNPGDVDFKKAPTAADLANQLFYLNDINCDVATIKFLLTNNVLYPKGSPIARAYGYLHSVNGVSSQGSYLLREAMHAVPVDENGRIYESTPTRASMDPDTQNYFSRLQEVRSSPIGPDEKVFAGEDPLKRLPLPDLSVPPIINYGIYGLGLFSAVVMGAEIYKKTKQKLEKFRRRTESQKAENALLKRKDIELSQAKDFLSWVSWAQREGVYVPPTQTEIPDKQTSVKNLKNNMNWQAVSRYLENPEAYEVQAGITQTRQKELFREVAKRVVAMG